MIMLHGEKLIMYFKNFQNKNQCLLGTQYNCEGFGIYSIVILLIGIKRCQKKNAKMQKGWVPLCTIQISTFLPTMHMASSCEATNWYSICRNPTLAKCGGEAQHLEKVGIGVLRDSQKLRRRFGRPKHLALGCSWCHWKGLET
jgi:hypothetical protein